MVGYLGVTRQPGDVEPEVGQLGPAIHRPAAIPQGLDGGAELLQRVQHSHGRHTLWQGRWPGPLTEKIQHALSRFVAARYILSRINYTALLLIDEVKMTGVKVL
jgi:hypothetical protein